MSWIQYLFDFIGRFWPFVVVYSFQRGVRFWCGVDRKILEPGLYAFLPGLGHIEIVNVKEDILRLENQNLTTKDGTALHVSSNSTYEVIDARKAFCAVQDYKNNLADECRTQLARGIREYTYAELLEDQSGLEESLCEDMNAAAEPWGITVSRVGLADFVRTKSLSLAKV
jgi:regulator of protease activity HflC (stomatin/prohibitin superfamily)